MTTVQNLLERLGLQQYQRPLQELGYDTPTKCRQLSDDVLIRAGVHLASHRRQILTAVVDGPGQHMMDTRSHDDDSLYGNAVVADMHEESRRGMQTACC